MSASSASLLAAASLTTSLIFLTLPAPASAEVCELRSVQNETRFPMRAQLRGHRGTVYLKVSVDEKGRATATNLHRSSGHRLLDRAAEQSVRKHWVFDVSKCEGKELPKEHLVAVEYQNDEYGVDQKTRGAQFAARVKERSAPTE